MTETDDQGVKSDEHPWTERVDSPSLIMDPKQDMTSSPSLNAQVPRESKIKEK